MYTGEFRVVKVDEHLKMCEVYYDDKGVVRYWEEVQYLEPILEAIKKPVLDSRQGLIIGELDVEL